MSIGTVGWSLLLSAYFLSLHKGSAPEFCIEESEKYNLDYDGCIEMLQVHATEFGDMIPLETDKELMSKESPSALL